MNKLTHFVLTTSMLMLGAIDANASSPTTSQQGQRIDVYGVQFCLGETPNDLACDVRLDASPAPSSKAQSPLEITRAPTKTDPDRPRTFGDVVWASAAPLVTTVNTECASVLPAPLSLLCGLELLGDASASGAKRAVDTASRGDS